MRFNKTEEYNKALDKCSMIEEIFPLIEQCILDEYGQREEHYSRTLEYPPSRELIMKLKLDLIERRMLILKEAEDQKRKEED